MVDSSEIHHVYGSLDIVSLRMRTFHSKHSTIELLVTVHLHLSVYLRECVRAFFYTNSNRTALDSHRKCDPVMQFYGYITLISMAACDRISQQNENCRPREQCMPDIIESYAITHQQLFEITMNNDFSVCSIGACWLSTITEYDNENEFHLIDRIGVW